MNANASEDVWTGLDIGVAAAFENRGKAVDRNEIAERVRNIGVRSRAAVKKKTPNCSLRKEPAEIKFAEGAIFRQEKVQADDFSLRRCNPADFAERGFEIGEIAQTVADENAVERRIGKRETAGVGANDIELAARASEVKHGRSKVCGDGFRCGRKLRDQLRKISSAAGEIENDGVWGKSSIENGLAFPSAIHAAGKGARDEVVARSNGAEHPAHEMRVVFFCGRPHAGRNCIKRRDSVRRIRGRLEILHGGKISKEGMT